jgi:hypothetical protein
MEINITDDAGDWLFILQDMEFAFHQGVPLENHERSLVNFGLKSADTHFPYIETFFTPR